MNVRYARAATAVAAAAASAAIAACGGSAESPTAATATLKPLAKDSSARGVARLSQAGDHLTGTIEVTGLRPGSGHAEHVHGPDGACSPPSKRTTNMAADLPDLEADGKGRAKEEIDVTVHQDVLAPGYFIVVHAKPEKDEGASAESVQALSDNPELLCGDLEATR